MRLPAAVPPGARVLNTEMPFAVRASSTRLISVVFPAPSPPSKVMNTLPLSHVLDFLDGGEFVARFEVHQAHSLCRSAHDADIFHRHAERLPCLRHEDNAVFVGDGDRSDHKAVSCGGDDGADANAAAVGLAEIFDFGPFSVPVFADG